MSTTTAEVFIPLGGGEVAVIDFEDWDKIRPFKWRLWRSKRGKYAISNGSRVSRVWLHKLIFGVVPVGFEVAHQDGDGLNCRRLNLKALTHQQNQQGKRAKKLGASSQYRGVSRVKQRKNWEANIGLDYRKIFLGRYPTEIEAAKAYDAAAIKHFGEHAALNF